MSKQTTFADILGQKKCATFAGNASQTKLFTIQISFSIMKKILNKYP